MPEMYALVSEEQSQQLQLIERKEFEDEEEVFEAINQLISHGIVAGDVKKLEDAGIYTYNDLMMQTKKNFTGIKGLSEAKVRKICEAAEKIVSFGYIGSDALVRKQSHELGGAIKGEIETSALTETFGKFGQGNLTPYRMAMKSMLVDDADGLLMKKLQDSFAIQIDDIGQPSNIVGDESYEGEEEDEGEEEVEGVEDMDDEGEMGADEDVEGGEGDAGGGEEGGDLIPIFLGQQDGGLQFLGHVDRADCIGMEDFYDVSGHVDDILHELGVELGEDFFNDFEIQLEPHALEEGFFRVPKTFVETLEAINRIVIRQHPFNG